MTKYVMSFSNFLYRFLLVDPSLMNFISVLQKINDRPGGLQNSDTGATAWALIHVIRKLVLMPRRRPVNAVISLKFYSDSIAGFAYTERTSPHFLFVLILYLRTVGEDVLEK